MKLQICQNMDVNPQAGSVHAGLIWIWFWICGTDKNIDAGLRSASAGLIWTCGVDLLG